MRPSIFRLLLATTLAATLAVGAFALARSGGKAGKPAAAQAEEQAAVQPATPPAATATAGSAGTPGTSAGRPPPVPLLWKVSDEDNSLYLLGSFHLLLPDDYPLSRDVDLAFADAEKLVFELAPEELASPQLGLQMAQAAMRGDGTTLDAQLGPELAARLAGWGQRNAAQLAATGMTVDVLQRFEPWFVGMTVTITRMMELGFDPALGLDMHMGGLAQAARKPTAGLETAAQQIAFLDGMEPAEQVQMLEQALDQAEAEPDKVMDLHAAWRAGDVETLVEETLVEIRRDFPALYRVINVERNDAWLPELEARLRDDGSDDSLVVVGAMHLIGEDGLVEKLRAKGYEVERICSACASP